MALAAWKARVRMYWSQVRVEAVDAEPLAAVQVGGEFPVQARVHLGALTPDDVAVELFLGQVNAMGGIVEGDVMPMQPVRPDGEASYLYQASAVTCHRSGLHGYTVRVLPYHPDLTIRFLPGFIVWA
jgi:starch phosphorylase